MAASAYEPPEPPDKRVARAHALDIAGRLASKVISHRAYTLGEPQFCYRIPFHTDDFWCTVFVSDTTYKLRINPKCDTGNSTFCASLKRERRIIGLKAAKKLPAVSNELGIEVFTTDFFDEQLVGGRLLAPAVKVLMSQIEFPPVISFFVNDFQLDFISELLTADHCAHQVRLLRELLLVINIGRKGKQRACST